MSDTDYTALVDSFLTHAAPIENINASIEPHKMTFFIGIPPPIIGNAQAKPTEAEKRQWGIREDLIFNTYPSIFPKFVKDLRSHEVSPPLPPPVRGAGAPTLVITVPGAPSPSRSQEQERGPGTSATAVPMPIHTRSNIVGEYKLVDFFSALGGHDKQLGTCVRHCHIHHATYRIPRALVLT